MLSGSWRRPSKQQPKRCIRETGSWRRTLSSRRHALMRASGWWARRRRPGATSGNAAVYLERAIERPRHVEVQVLADQHGSCVYLGERDCSLQRRHQKVIEESPSPAVTPSLRREMGSVAVRAALASGYTNA